MKYLVLSIRAVLPLLMFSSFAGAQLRLPAVISSGMVLQQHDSVSIWGWSNPGQTVYVTTGWNNRVDSTVASNGAVWILKVATPAAGGPYDLTISSGDTIHLKDIMIGEVWVCSGQSNMELSYLQGAKDIGEELPKADFPDIRFFQVPKSTSSYPQDDVRAKWTPCDSNALKSFSAVAYFFGKRLRDSLHVPVGLILSCWGGTPAETWTPENLVLANTALSSASAKLDSVPWWPVRPGAAYNAMIAPLTHFTIAGSIWYQGESNVGTNATYSKLFTTMIDGWRNAWHRPFPFYYVQIAPFNYGDNLNGALLQEQQTESMSHPNVGMIVTTDLIDSVTNIHPSKKRQVGVRLANWALAETYKQPGVVYKSPAFAGLEKKSGALVLSFNNAPLGLMSRAKKVTGFWVCDTTGRWQPAEASIKKDKITVRSKLVKDPSQVRYGFSNTLAGNVFSTEGLPLIPFRTDHKL